MVEELPFAASTITGVGLAVGSSAPAGALVAGADAVPCWDPWGAPGWGRGPVRLVTPAPAGAPVAAAAALSWYLGAKLSKFTAKYV